MNAANAIDCDIEELRSRNERARLQVETLQLESQLALIAPDTTRVVMEAWGDLVDPREHLYDTPDWGYRQGVPYSQLSDRLDGKFLPIYETEQDLAFIRGSGRLLAEHFAGGINIQETLADYTIGSGCTYVVQEAKGFKAPAELVPAVQKVIDVLLDDNDWSGSGEREAHNRSREDGESLIHIVPHGWKARLRFLEPDQLRDPQGFGRDLENWLGCGEEFASSWTFGVHTRKDCPSEPLGYHIVHDNAGFDYEYVPEARLQHIKRNVHRNAKRGVSDFYPVVQWLNHAEKVLRNTASGAAVQAAIAFIRQHAQGTSSNQASALASGNAYRQSVQQTPAGARTRNAQRYDPGTILDIAYGMEYKSGPMGSERAPQFINVIQAALRYCGVRWGMHEGIVSGDWSNANLASMLAAEAPFVKRREADQRQYCTAFHSIAWKAVRIAYEAGFFDRFGVTLKQLEACIDIVITPPAVATRDPLQRAQAAQVEMAAGTLSRRTAAAEAGRDYDAERENMHKDGDAPATAELPAAGGSLPASTASAAGGEADVAATALNGAQVTSLMDVLTRVSTGQLPRETAAEAIKAAFPLLTQQQIAGMLNPLEGFTPAIVDPKTGQPAPTSGEPSGEFGDKTRLQWKRNIKAIRDVLDGLIAKEHTPAMAKELLLSLGVADGRADRLIADAQDNATIDDPELAESLMETSYERLQRAASILFEGYP